ncbi:hypothetical protein OS31_13670 [Dickeya oryzae]
MMQREEVLEQALALLEQRGFADTTLEMLADQLGVSPAELLPFWPDREALLYDSLRYHSQQISIWRKQVQLDEHLSPEQKTAGALPTFTGRRQPAPFSRLSVYCGLQRLS